MNLNHINLPVPDVAAACTFFEQYFDFKTEEVKGDHMIAVLKGKDGFVLVLMANALNKQGNITYPGAFHIGFLLDAPAQVQDMYERLKNDGKPVEREPQKIRDSFGFYFHIEGGIMIEIAAPLQQ